MFSKFGRGVRDNGSGTDHGTGSVAFVLGEKVKDGHYGEMPSLKPEFGATSTGTWTSTASTRRSSTKYRENQRNSGSVTLSFFRRSIVKHQR
jgi:uncharacterized protein (DUF1501 family)